MDLNSANSMMDFFTGLLGHVATILMQPPYVYFTACFLGIAIVGVVKKIIK